MDEQEKDQSDGTETMEDLAGIGLGTGLYHAPAFSLISRQSYSSSRIFAYHNIGGYVGAGFGPLIVAVLLAFHDWRTVLLITAIPFLVMGVLFHFTGPTDTSNRNRSQTDHDHISIQTRQLFVAGFLFIAALYLIRGVYQRGTLTFLPDFLNLTSGLPPVRIFGKQIPPGRWIYSLVLLIGAGGEFAGGWLGEWADPENLLAALFLVSAVVLGFLGDLTSWPLFAATAGLRLLLYTFPPVLQDLVAEYSPEASRGFGYGLTTAGNVAAGGFIGSSLSGWLATVGTYSFVFKVLALFPIVGLIVVFGFARWGVSKAKPTVD